MRTEQMIEFDIIFLLFGLLVCILYKVFNKENNKIQWIDILIIVILVVIASVRCNVGSDYYGYFLRYNGVLQKYASLGEIFTYSSSILFDIICYYLKMLTNFNYAIFWFVSLSIYPALILFLRKISKKPYMGLFIFIFSGMFLISNNILRQAMAMVLLFIAYRCLINKKFMKYALLVIFATFFHNTALIAGAIMLIAIKLTPNWNKLIAVNMIGIVIVIFFNQIVGVLDAFLPSKYLGYISNNYGAMIKQMISIAGYVVLYNILVAILLKHKEKLRAQNKDFDKYLSLLIIAIPISIIAIRCWPINRLALYFYQFIIILLPLFFEQFKKKKIVLMVVLLLVGWFGFINIFGGDNEYYQYETYFGNTIPMYPRDYDYGE